MFSTPLGFFHRTLSRHPLEAVYNYRVYLETDTSVRSMTLLLAAYSTESSAAVGAWRVLTGPNNSEPTGVQSGGVGTTVS